MPARPEPLHATFLVTDIVDSTSLVDQIGDQRWFELLAAHHGLVRRETASRGGHEVSFCGDGFILAFDLAAAAARCAIAIQRAVHAREAAAALPFSVRIALHTGSALRHENSVIGRAVHHACLLAEVAQPGEILLSPLAAGSSGMSTEPVAVDVRGRAGRVQARRLSWQRTATGRFHRPRPRWGDVADAVWCTAVA